MGPRAELRGCMERDRPGPFEYAVQRRPKPRRSWFTFRFMHAFRAPRTGYILNRFCQLDPYSEAPQLLRCLHTYLRLSILKRKRDQSAAGAPAMADSIEAGLLQALDQNGTIADTGAFAASAGVDHLAVVGVMKSLQAAEMVLAEVCACITPQ